jgi:ribose transport system substrate-binding protein
MNWIKSRKFWKVSLPLLLVAAITFFVWHRKSSVHPPRVVVILPSPSNPYWIEVRRGVEREAAILGDKFSVDPQSSLNMDAASQIDLLNSYLTHNAVDALVLGPASDTQTVTTVAKYSAIGIPIVVIDTELNQREVLSNQVKISAFIGSDNIDGGHKAAATIADALKSSKSKRVLLIEGSRVHQSAIDRADSFSDVAAKEGLTVIHVPGEWKRDRAQELVTAKFAHSHFDAIFASNDDMALGAVAAMKARGAVPNSDGWPIIVGFDATHDGLAAVSSHEMYATIQQDAYVLGERGVVAAVKALNRDPSLLPREMLAVKVRTQ